MIGTGKNPNVAACVVIGIEPKWTKRIVDAIATTGKPVEGFSIEGAGDINTIMRASQKAQEFSQWASEKQREECPLSDLWISVKCGESDTTSGMAANPAVPGVAGDFSYHDFRDHEVEEMLPAMRYLVDSGYTALRMGSVVNNKLEAAEPQIIDYASYLRTDFLDIFLSAKCEFFVGDPGGLSTLPLIFRRPIVYINSIPVMAPTCISSWLNGTGPLYKIAS